MVKNTLTVGRIEEGFVLDHIQGEAWISINICIWTNLTAVLRSLKMQKVIKWERKIS